MFLNHHRQKQAVYYNKIYQERKAVAMRPLEAYKDFLKHLEPLAEGKNFLDVGCGTGYLLKLVAEQGLQTYGVDISEQAVKVAQQNNPYSDIQVASAENLPFLSNFFDYISCLGSLEHFNDLKKGLLEMTRVTKPSALFLLVVPNKNYLFWRFKKEKGTAQREIGEKLLSLKEWLKIFQEQGLKIIKIKSDKYPTQSLSWFYSWNPIKIFKRLVFKLVWLVLPLNYTYQFIFICQKNIAGI